MNHDLLAVQDTAWTIKDTCDDLAPRKLSERDVATLQSVKRDLDRLHGKLLAIRDKRKRDKGEDESDAPATNGQPAQPALLGDVR